MVVAQTSALIGSGSAFVADGRRRWFSPTSLLLLVVSLAVATQASIIATNANRQVTAALLFIVTVLINGSLAGMLQGLVAAVYVTVVYTLFVRFPVYIEGLDAIDDIFPVFAMTLTAVLSGAVSGKLRDRMIEADRARRRLTRLFDYSNELQRALSLEQIVRALTAAVPDGRALDAILDSVRVEATLPDHGRWNEAVSAGLADRARIGSGALPAWPEQLSSADEEAIANLTVMAVERVELLEEHASAQAVISSERVKTAMLSSLSHDLRTPIAVVSAVAGTLKSYGGMIEDANRAEMLDTILEQCGRLDAFTGKLLSLGRMEAGIADRFELVDVEEVLGSVIATTRTAFPDRRIVRRIAPEPAFIMASPVLLEQVLFNVLENALGYSPADTEVQMMLDGPDDMVAITVVDQGCGISAADLPHIFERFYRGDNGSERSGNGLGLAITKAFLDMIGGQVEVTSPAENGKGTRVRILLPRATIETAEDLNG